MRKMLCVLSIAVFASCNSGTDSKVESMSSKDSAASANDNIILPYATDYSSKFEMGDAKNAKTILDLYKDWDNNNLDNSKDKFADSVTMYFSGGDMMHGSRDTILAQTKPFRNSLGTVTTAVHSVVSLRSTDKNEDWVLAWFKEYRTDAKGKKDSTEFQETWRLNKDGKADLLYQYEVNKPAPSKK
jgi:hypothetical protein